LRIDVAARRVQVNDEPVMLTRTEFDVLAILSSRPGVVFTRRELRQAIWGMSWTRNAATLDVHVGNLRRKFGDDPSNPRYVKTVRGVGFLIGNN
jgi:DNA-binding response OmpR family regulator